MQTVNNRKRLRDFEEEYIQRWVWQAMEERKTDSKFTSNIIIFQHVHIFQCLSKHPLSEWMKLDIIHFLCSEK